MNLTLPDIRHNPTGFEALVCLFAQTRSCAFDTVEIDMSTTTWFDADMCAAFGAILCQLSENLNTIKLININPGIESVLSKNGFLSHYGREKMPDHWQTTIPYQRFDRKDERYFAGYIDKELANRAEMPTMSPGLLKKFRQSIFEIFNNAVSHSHTQLGIFSCGQFFPRRNRLNFSIADLGIGIRRNIQECSGLNLSPEEALIWATKGQNTTKRFQVPGGLGLKLLTEFIDWNGGHILIVSDAGCWARRNKETITQPLSYAFPGTVVNVGINTADTNSYQLVSELNAADIF